MEPPRRSPWILAQPAPVASLLFAATDDRRARVLKFLEKKVWPALPKSQAGRGLTRAELAVTVVPFGEAEWRVAVDAFVRYGRGRHKASLNFGDCLAYASAAAAGDSLLFAGDDFTPTDIRRA
jgi:uncharacterized protein with PIN domain